MCVRHVVAIQLIAVIPPVMPSTRYVAVLCNRAEFKANQTGPKLDRDCIGDASESAIFKYVSPCRTDANDTLCSSLHAR